MAIDEIRADGFRWVEGIPVVEVRGEAVLLEHERSGARVLHIRTLDSENLFSISFRTPPPDDTGVPHIIEHSVLAGSQRFPVRDPFFEMVKMSMATFINAMTGADCTYYPVCSNVRQDLLNLADVYFDAVFHPILAEDTLKKEGHHLTPKDPEAPTGAVTVTGIVYNEMKSALSNPDSSLYYTLNQALFPIGIYGRNSGGDPVAIPDLSFAQFQDYYRRTYHPSNAYIVLYGNLPTEAYLAFLKPRLDAFVRQPPAPPVVREPRWSEPRRVVRGYPVGEGEPLRERTFLVMEWLMGDAADADDAARMHVLNLLLLGNDAAPLKRALIESHLGQALAHTGMSSRGCEGTFGVGLKGSEPERAAAFEALVLETLSALSQATFTAGEVDAAFQQAGYHYQEIDEHFPLEVLERVLSGWVYDRPPCTFLTGRARLAACRHAYGADPRLFNRLIADRIVANPHRLTMRFAPDADMERREAERFETRMQEVRAGLDDDQMRRLSNDAAALEQMAGQPNSPAALATLPQLRRSDLPTEPQRIPHAAEPIDGGGTLLVNDVFANGINYLTLEIDLGGLPDALWDAMPRYIDALHKLGAGGDDFAALARRKARHTGGLSAAVRLRSRADAPGTPIWGLQVSLRFLDEGIEEALDVLQDCLFAVNPRDVRRLEDVLVQALAGYRTGLVQAGTSTAITHGARRLTQESALKQRTSGLPQLRRTVALAADFAAGNAHLMEQIESIRAFVAARTPVVAGFTGSARAGEAVRQRLGSWAKANRNVGKPAENPAFAPSGAGAREGLVAPIQVAHCAQILCAPHASSPDAPLLMLATKLLAVDYMYSEIRFKGNAYGAQCSYWDGAGLLVLGSYADPHIARTLGVFEGMADYIRQAPWTPVELDRAIISAAKNFHKPIRPGDATGETLESFRVGRTHEMQARYYASLLGATAADVKRAILDVLDREFASAPICVMAGARMLEQANRELARPLALEVIFPGDDVNSEG